MPDLAAQLRELHQSDDAGVPFCVECCHAWPCRTIRLADNPRRWRLLYTASRLVTDRAQVYADLDTVLAAHPRLLVRHGACRRGGDVLAAAWVNQRRREGCDVIADPRPAPWSLLGRIAGPMRNAYMVGLGADEWLAHVHPDSRTGGATGCATFADWAGVTGHREETR